MEIIERTIRIDSVHPGPKGGAFIFGVPAGELDTLGCAISSSVLPRLPGKGEFWKVKGMMVDGQKGPHLKANYARPADLPSASYVSSLLVKHPAFRGFALGRKKVRDLIGAFGEEGLVEYLDEGNVYKLAEVINPPVAEGLVDAWHNLRNQNATINFLIEHKFSAEIARKVLFLCREGTDERLRKNPYSLVCFGGITKNIWGTMEKCAKSLNLERDFSGRLVGGIEHVLYEHLRDGHTAMAKSSLLKLAASLLGTRSRAEEGLRMAIEKKFVCVYPMQPEPIFQLVGVGIMEQMLERRIDKLVSGPRQISLFESDETRVKILVDSYDHVTREGGGPTMNVEQKRAVIMALTNRCSVITGYGGTGKTTVLKAVADIAKGLGRPTYMLALAGKAKERLRQITNHKSFTIHAFIGAVKKGAEDICLDSDPLIVIDECSMVDTALFNNLLGLLEEKQYSLLTVGDTAQISPVGFGLVWHRMALMVDVPRTNLTQVYRQRSTLHDLAMKVRSKDPDVLGGIVDSIPDWNGEAEGVFFVSAESKGLYDKLFKLKTDVDDILKQQVRASYQDRLQEVALEVQMQGLEDDGRMPKSVILTPHMSKKKRDSGERISNHLQRCITPLNDGMFLADRVFRVGDPVIVTENSYDLNLFNGTTGTLLRVASRHGELRGCFQFDSHKKPVWLSPGDMIDIRLRLAYAVSIHKSQGSEYESVLVTCVESSPMLEQSLLYTALTRSKGLCLLVGSRKVIDEAVRSPSRADTLEVGFFLSRMNHYAMAR